MNTPTYDGGSAFPVPPTYNPDMSVWYHGHEGMTLRDYFAAKFMQARFSNYETILAISKKEITPQSIAETSYAMADIMLKARVERNGNE
jgi:hypothetical protein